MDHIKIDFYKFRNIYEINKMSDSNTEILSVSSKKKPAKKCSFHFTKESFFMYNTWIKEFFMMHHIVFESISNNLENFYKVLETKFFDWLNQPKNSSKFMFEIKKEFMAIADEILIHEIMFERFKKSENQFVIPVFQENSESNSESDVEIDYLPDPDPCYNLMEDRQKNIHEYTSDIEISNYDDEFYLSFFVKN